MLTIVIANITPREAAEHFQRAGLSGTVVESLGFGSWGIEPGARIEFGEPAQSRGAVRETVSLLIARGEDCAFVAPGWGAVPYLIKSDGNVEPLA